MIRVNVSIDVPHLEEGLRFYSRTFGFRELSRPFPTMAVLDAHNVMVCLHEKKSGSLPTPEESVTRRYERHWTPVHLDLHVPSVQETLQIALAEGATLERRFDHPKPVAFCSDPFGNGFCLIEETSRTRNTTGET